MYVFISKHICSFHLGDLNMVTKQEFLLLMFFTPSEIKQNVQLCAHSVYCFVSN